MRRKLLVMGLVLLLSVTGCKSDTTEDIYTETESETEITSNNQQDTSSVTTDDTDASTDDDDVATDDTSTTVTEDVYDQDTVEVDPEEVDVIAEVTSVDDPAFIAQVQNFIELFYYNLFFVEGDFTEGIDEGTKIKFAISYIYQHEYNELKFDTETFVLYVPEDRVEALVEKYFGSKVSGHSSFETENIPYEDGYYLMPAVDAGWTDEVVIEGIEQSGDFDYLVRFANVYEDGTAGGNYEADLTLKDGRLIMSGFMSLEPDSTEGSDQ